MNRRGITLLVLLLLPMVANANEYTDLLRKAEQMEDSLGPMELVTLALATTSNMKEAQETCRQQAGGMHDGMGVVFEFDGEGQVTRTWARNGSKYELCFAASMSEQIEYVPPEEPFYTAIDFGRD